MSEAAVNRDVEIRLIFSKISVGGCFCAESFELYE